MFRAPARAAISASLSTSLMLSAQNATRHSFGRCSGDSVTPKNSVAPSAPATSNCNRSEEHTSELQSLAYLVCRLLLEKKKKTNKRKRQKGKYKMKNTEDQVCG